MFGITLMVFFPFYSNTWCTDLFCTNLNVNVEGKWVLLQYTFITDGTSVRMSEMIVRISGL